MNYINLWDKENFYSWYCIIKNTKKFFKTLKWTFQRAKRGYSDMDLWNLGDYLAQVTGRSIIDLSKITSGYPDSVCETYEDWQNKLASLGQTLIDTDSFYPQGKYINQYEESYNNIGGKITYTELPNGLLQVNPPEYTKEELEIVDNYMREDSQIHKLRVKDRRDSLEELAKIWEHLYD